MVGNKRGQERVFKGYCFVPVFKGVLADEADYYICRASVFVVYDYGFLSLGGDRSLIGDYAERGYPLDKSYPFSADSLTP